MVSDVYGAAERGYRLPTPHVPAGDVAWEALTLIRQQEVGHSRFIEARLQDGVLQGRALSAELMSWLGTMEGRFLAGLTGRPGLRRILAKLAVQLGARFAPRAVPAFTHALAEMDLREFFLLCAALETTARQSYSRMEQLARALAAQRATDLRLASLVRELPQKTLDETFHEAAFQEMATWVVDGHLDAALTARGCAVRLVDLLPRGEARRDLNRIQVLTDGGLASLFRKHGLSVVVEPVAGAPQAQPM